MPTRRGVVVKSRRGGIRRGVTRQGVYYGSSLSLRNEIELHDDDVDGCCDATVIFYNRPIIK